MSGFPAIAHVAVTVNDLAAGVPWYERLIGAGPVLDEDTENGFHHTVFLIGGTRVGLHAHPTTDSDGIALEFFAPPS